MLNSLYSKTYHIQATTNKKFTVGLQDKSVYTHYCKRNKKSSTLPGFLLRCGIREKSQAPLKPVKTKRVKRNWMKSVTSCKYSTLIGCLAKCSPFLLVAALRFGCQWHHSRFYPCDLHALFFARLSLATYICPFFWKLIGLYVFTVNKHRPKKRNIEADVSNIHSSSSKIPIYPNTVDCWLFYWNVDKPG